MGKLRNQGSTPDQRGISRAAESVRTIRGVFSETIGSAVCSGGMKEFLWTCLKVIAAAALVVVLFHVWPLLAVPVSVLLVLLLPLGIALLVGVAVTGAVGVATLVALLSVAILVVAALSPVWIPVALIAGIIWAIKKLGGAKRPLAAA